MNAGINPLSTLNTVKYKKTQLNAKYNGTIAMSLKMLSFIPLALFCISEKYLN